VLGFDWDEGNRAKCQTHGVTIAEIELVFANAPLVAPDIRHSVAEDRLVAIGANERGRRIFIAFTVRIRADERLIRPISARFMRDKEFLRYAQDGATHDDR
jgi:uncharacterized DUF497 family protein